MKTAINKENVLPNVMIRDVLTANPQSAKSASLLQAIDERFDPMPGYMMAEIMQGQNTSGAKELLEQKLARHITNRAKSFNNLIYHYKQDTINSWVKDSLLALLNTEPYPEPRYQAAFIYFENGDSLNMQNTLNNIPTDFELTDKETIIHNLYLDLFDILSELQSDSITTIDSIQEASLLNIAQYNYLLPSVYARNILLKYDLITYIEPIYLPDNLKRTPYWQDTNPDIRNNQKLLKVFPNPAGNYFIIEYDLSEFQGNSFLVISGINGKRLKLFILKSEHNQLIISTENFKNGTYLVQLLLKGRLKEAAKIVIIK